MGEVSLMFSFEEKTYNTNLPIKYVLQEGRQNKKYLVVIFSGCNPPNDKIQHSYNYMRTLRKLDCNKLFILDEYGPRGCYYLGENMSFEVETCVISLITFIARKLNIKWDNIIFAGSSKGGSSALYFGLKYNIPYVISGVPQIRIADFLLDESIETAEYILGEQMENGRINALNTVIYKQLNKEILSEIYIMTSENDHQYESQMKPLLKKLNDKNIAVILNMNNKMRKHDEIDEYFPNYLINVLMKIMYSFEIINCSVINKDTYTTCVKLDLSGKLEELSFKYIFVDFNNNTHVYETKEHECLIQSKSPDLYKVYVEIYNVYGKIFERYIGKILHGVELKDSEP